ncbi:hypothetical protein FGB62_95g088 [Gracilaria domingensis]|nr:hypothetical protein FGB62_95g088 [Gracilaria domingensis]
MPFPHSNSHFSAYDFAPSSRREAHLRRRRQRLADYARFDDVLERSSVDRDQTIFSHASSSEQTQPFRNRNRYAGSYSSRFKLQPESYWAKDAQFPPNSLGSGARPHSWHMPTVHDPSNFEHHPSTYSLTASEQVGVSLVWMVARLLMLVIISIPIGYLFMYIRQTLRSGEPLQQLRAFALQEAANNKIDNIEELPVDGLKLYAQATCVKGPTVKHVKEALHLQLRNIPEQARADIIDSAVVEGMDTVSTRQDTAADVADSGKAFSYLAYWNTKFNGDQVLVPSDRYSTCIMAAGVDVKIGEQIAGYEESSRRVPIGTRPCECGLFWCVGRCPEYDKVSTRRPVFKRHQLTLRNQNDLHRWMVKQAVSHTESLLHSKGALSGSWDTSRSRNVEVPGVSWQAPHEDYFTGKDNVGDAPDPDRAYPRQEL